jgi:MYXO-CTERM domain-containing protein
MLRLMWLLAVGQVPPIADDFERETLDPFWEQNLDVGNTLGISFEHSRRGTRSLKATYGGSGNGNALIRVRLDAGQPTFETRFSMLVSNDTATVWSPDTQARALRVGQLVSGGEYVVVYVNRELDGHFALDLGVRDPNSGISTFGITRTGFDAGSWIDVELRYGPQSVVLAMNGTERITASGPQLGMWDIQSAELGFTRGVDLQPGPTSLFFDDVEMARTLPPSQMQSSGRLLSVGCGCGTGELLLPALLGLLGAAALRRRRSR